MYVGSGSRNEDLATSGTSYLTQKMMLRGTQSKSKSEIYEEIENMGAQYDARSEREYTRFTLAITKDQAPRAVQMLGDMISNSAFHSAELEMLKDEVSAEHEANHTRFTETLIENVHFNSFREHMIGQPIKGDRDLTHTLTLDNVRDYYNANYYGDNIVVVATGDVNHDEIVAAVDHHFSSLPKSTDIQAKNSEKPIYIPALLMMRDDEMVNSNVGVFYDAPSVKHEDFHSFVLLQSMFGTYKIDENAGHLNDTHKQYNSMHSLLGALPDVTQQTCHYMPYSDCGIFGNTFFGNEVFTRQMNYAGVCLPTIYSHYLNDVEVVRGRNKLYNQLLTCSGTRDTNELIGW